MFFKSKICYVLYSLVPVLNQRDKRGLISNFFYISMGLLNILTITAEGLQSVH